MNRRPLGRRRSSGAGSHDSSLAARYRALVAAGVISDDRAQAALVDRLDRLNRALAGWRPAARGRRLGRIFTSRDGPPKGLYVHGEVGRGKSMLMDEFFAVAAAAPKRRVHFNEFMGDIQDRLHLARTRAGGKAAASDPVAIVAAEVARETRLLCLDEFMVTDIADAMILSRLFAELFARGVVLVATSNSAPEELYKDGLNRGLFLPFVDVLRQHVDVVRLDAAGDYRLGKLAGTPVYVTPLGAAARAALDGLWRTLTGAASGEPLSLPHKGRAIRVPQALRGAARFSFADLCEAPLGAGDYQKIARAFHTILVDDVPVLADARRDTTRRLILLVDTLYDHRVKLIVSAAAEPAALYTATRGAEAIAFRRTVSRLIEMRSAAYLGAAHGLTAPAESETAPAR